MIINYIKWYKTDLLLVFLTISEDGIFQLQALIFNFNVLLYRKRSLKWFNFGCQLSKDLTRNEWTTIIKFVGIQILYRYFATVISFILYNFDYKDAVNLYQLIISTISFCINLLAIEIYWTSYFYTNTILKGIAKDMNEYQDLEKISRYLIDIQNLLGHVDKYFSKPILLVFGLIFVGGICNVSVF